MLLLLLLRRRRRLSRLDRKLRHFAVCQARLVPPRMQACRARAGACRSALVARNNTCEVPPWPWSPAGTHGVRRAAAGGRGRGPVQQCSRQRRLPLARTHARTHAQTHARTHAARRRVTDALPVHLQEKRLLERRLHSMSSQVALGRGRPPTPTPLATRWHAATRGGSPAPPSLLPLAPLSSLALAPLARGGWLRPAGQARERHAPPRA
jgi:hypothetical protein